MPTYEMPTLLRVMQKPELAAALKRVAQAIFSTGGFIRKIENLGEKDLPCKASAHGGVYKKANCFLFYFDVPPASLKDIDNEYKRDIDIIRALIYKQVESSNEKCTLHEELLPPVYRPDVKKMLAIAEKRAKRKAKSKFSLGVDYHPFQK